MERTRRDEPRHLGAPMLLFALGLHVVLVLALPETRERVLATLETVAFDVVDSPPEAAPEPEPEPVAVQEPRIRVAPRELPPEEPPPPEAPPPPPPPPAVFNTTLSNVTGSSSWAVQASSGIESDRPLANPVPGGRPGGVEGGVPGGVEGGVVGAPPGPTVVPVGDLSRRPEPPAGMDSLLRRFYPERARAQGVAGQAVARFRINPDGSISNLRVASESIPGYEFGIACVRALQAGGHWPSTPLDRDGRPVATNVTFNCDFQVGGR